MLDSQTTRDFLARYAEKIHAHAQELTDLDAAIGDADHGSNMDRGMSEVAGRLPQEGNPAALLKSAAMTLISRVGGASGPLYGTALLRWSAAHPDLEIWTLDDLRGGLEAAYTGLLERGKAEPGDKTMLDVWRPALDALKTGTLQDAADAAHAAAGATAPMQAKKGRASYLGERSVGHKDPGSVSSALLFEALAEAAGGAKA